MSESWSEEWENEGTVMLIEEEGFIRNRWMMRQANGFRAIAQIVQGTNVGWLRRRVNRVGRNERKEGPSAYPVSQKCIRIIGLSIKRDD